MRATELMIGDWVEVERLDNPDGCHPIIWYQNGNIEEMRIDDVTAYFDEGDRESFIDYFDIKPIPITTEILEKNGFERFGTSYILREYLFELTNPSVPVNYLDNYWLNVCGRNINIKFVHELQHALRLFGIEKEIIL